VSTSAASSRGSNITYSKPTAVAANHTTNAWYYTQYEATLDIVFTGLPGTGKTTLSKQMSASLGIPLIAKDAIKEIMYDTIGWSDKAFSAKLAQATFGIMEYVIEEQLRAGNAMIVEANYAPHLASKRFQQWQEQYGCAITQVVCRTELTVLANRYFTRQQSGQRHAGHVDNNRTADFERRVAVGEDQPLAVAGEVKIIDTTVFATVEATVVAEWLRSTGPSA
jgi:predicted kinase